MIENTQGTKRKQSEKESKKQHLGKKVLLFGYYQHKQDEESEWNCFDEMS